MQRGRTRFPELSLAIELPLHSMAGNFLTRFVETDSSRRVVTRNLPSFSNRRMVQAFAPSENSYLYRANLAGRVAGYSSLNRTSAIHSVNLQPIAVGRLPTAVPPPVDRHATSG